MAGLSTFIAPISGFWWIIPVLSLPHCFYYWLWHRPEQWIATTLSIEGLTSGRKPADIRRSLSDGEVGTKSCHMMASVAHVLKLLQFACIYLWFTLYTPTTLSPSRLVAHVQEAPLQVALGLLLAGAGQTFNVAIYRAIGENGVYYGNRFHAPLGPWVTGFPFNVGLRHPQYFGVLLTLFGAMICVWHGPAGEAGLLSMCLVWTVFYAVTSAHEQEEDGSGREDGPRARRKRTSSRRS